MPRDGSGQLSRYLTALDPSYAPVDGRSFEDLLVFAKRYAGQVRFYDIPESAIDDNIAPEHVSWREFFRRDMAVIAASISVVDTAKLKRDYDQNRDHLDAHPSAGTLNDLFDPILGIVAQIDRWYSIAIQENPLHNDLELAINSSLREQVKKIVAYEEAYKHVDTKHPLKLDFTVIENSSLWGLDETIEPDSTIYQGATLADQIRYAALYVDEIFHAFYGFMTDLVEVKSVQYMHFALEAYPAHQPHMALFITFLELFRLAQNQMNGLTGRMLDFYYQDVLHLAPKPSVADRVHIVFELAKDVGDYDLAQGTALKAGKDTSGKEQVYATETDLVINQAKVKELKTVFIQKTQSIDSTTGQIDAEASKIDGVFARPVANSLDGFGEKITDPSGKWPTFGKGNPSAQKPRNICQVIDQYKEISSRKDQAQIGFAIATPQLVLQGGNRLIAWHIQNLSNLLPEPVEAKAGYELEIWLTGEKGWLKISAVLADADITKLKLAERFGIFDTTLSTSSGYYINRDNDSLHIYLPVAENAIIPFDAKLHAGYPYVTAYPVAQIMLGSSLNIDYATFDSLSLYEQSLTVRVGSMLPSKAEMEGYKDAEQKIFNALPKTIHLDGLKTLVLQNDNGLLDANKPFDPFTAYPGKGKSLYVGSAEVFNKPLGKLAIEIKKNLDIENKVTGSNFVTMEMVATQLPPEYAVSVLAGRHWFQLSNETGDDFTRKELAANILYRPEIDINGKGTTAKPFALDRTPIETVSEWQSQTVKGFVRIDNLRAVTIGNNTYIQASQELAPDLQIKEISVSYYSELVKLDPLIDQFFHVYPFGVTEVFFKEQNNSSTFALGMFGPLSTAIQLNFKQGQGNLFTTLDSAKDNLLVNADGHLLPQFTYLSPNAVYQPTNLGQSGLSEKHIMETLILEASGIRQTKESGNNQYSGDLQEEGMLFIGLEKLQPLNTLSLLFQFADGSADDEDNDPPEIHWSYLADNEWRPLKGEALISDGTYGFQTTGIVKLEVPEDSTDHNTIIPDGLRWFCASVTEHADRIPMLVNVVAQAVEAQFIDNGNDQSHFDTALAAGSISKLAVAVAQVSKVEQPFASFDGKHQEIGKEFYTRASERLRHKARAITPWDYEHLVLDRFPSIYKVKCITHSDPNCLCRSSSVSSATRDSANTTICCGPQIAPGHVLIIPVANLKNRNAANPLQPKTGRRTLLEIQDYLSKRTSPFVHIHAKNPVYEQVLVFFRVQFNAGTDKGYYLKQLNDEIVHYLTPWAFDESVEVSFAQKFYASAIINFIEERPYVDFITDFLMFVCRDECCPADRKVAEADTAENIEDVLAHVSGCCDLEALFANSGNFIGEVIAEPSTPRSILVSAPKHIIIPYEAPIEISACEQRKSARTKGSAATAVMDKPAIAVPERKSPVSSAKTAASATTITDIQNK